MVKVMSLMSGEMVAELTCDPKMAVIGAYAQSRNDNNTWQYNERYGHMVTEGKHFVTCGDFTARK